MTDGPFGFGDDRRPPPPERPAAQKSSRQPSRRPLAERFGGTARTVPAGPSPSWAREWAGSPRGAVRPPAGWLWGALALAVLAAAGALVLGGTVGVAFVCWLAAGPVGIGLVAVFVLLDTRAAAAPIYLRPWWIRPLYVVTIIAVIAGIGAGAWRIADWWGRL